MKGKYLIIVLCFTILSTVTVFAQECYDYRKENICNFEEYEEICGMEKNILGTFSHTDDTGNKKNVTKLDISKGVKVLRFDAKDFIEQLNSDAVIQYLANYDDYCWRIPVQDRGENGADYAVVYMNYSGKWSYYTTSSENKIGSQQVEYIFDLDLVDQILSENEMIPEQLYAIGISNIGLDCIVVQSQGEIGIIPFASRPEFLGVDNGKVYSPEAMSQKIKDYLDASSYDFTAENASGGGVSAKDKNDDWLIVSVGVVCLIGSVIIYKITKKRKVY